MSLASTITDRPRRQIWELSIRKLLHMRSLDRQDVVKARNRTIGHHSRYRRLLIGSLNAQTQSSVPGRIAFTHRRTAKPIRRSIEDRSVTFIAIGHRRRAMGNKRKVVPNERGDHSCRWSGEARDGGPSFYNTSIGGWAHTVGGHHRYPRSPFFSVDYPFAGRHYAL